MVIGPGQSARWGIWLNPLSMCVVTFLSFSRGGSNDMPQVIDAEV